MQNKNKLYIAGISALGVLTLGLSTYAYFSDNVKGTTDGKVGTVDIELTQAPTVSHSYKGEAVDYNNLNPGDNDPSTPSDETRRDGTDHELSFSVENKGTKSILTRTVITVTGYAANGEPLAAEDLKKVILSEKNAESPETIVPLTPDNSDTNSVSYVVGGTDDRLAKDTLNGVGQGAETEEGVSATTLSKTFDIGLLHTLGGKADDVKSPLEGATLYFNVQVQAMQYRNTTSGDWDTIFERKVDIKTIE